MRKQLCVLISVIALVLLGLSWQAVYAATVTLSAPTVEGSAGGTVEVPIAAADATGLGAVHVELVYNPAVLKAEAVTRGALAGNNALVESNVNKEGRVVIGIVAPDSINGSGTVATVRFQVLGAAGQTSSLNFENSAAWERESYAEVLVQTTPGQVTIAAGIPGWVIPAAIGTFALLAFLLLFMVLRRRRPAPAAIQTAAYAPPPSSAPPPSPRPTSAPPSSAPPGGSSTRPTNLPEIKSAPQSQAGFQNAEDQYYKLKGQLSTGRITQEQFEQQMRDLMVEDGQGRFWMLGADTGKWYVHQGDQWIEGTPY